MPVNISGASAVLWTTIPIEEPAMTARRSRTFVLSLLAFALAALALPAFAHGAPAPSLRLVVGSEQLTAYRYSKREPIDLGVWIAAVGGDFELRLTRASYEEPFSLAQVDSVTGESLRAIPQELVDGTNGVSRFLAVTVRDADETVVARRRFGWCPSDGERQRLDDLGAVTPRYTTYCGAWFPFLRGMVWGIDDHWAVDAFGSFGEEGGGGPRLRSLPDGTYGVRVAITSAHRSLFEVKPEDAALDLVVTIVTRTHGGEGPFQLRRQTAGPESGVPTTTEPAADTLPDLEALPAWSIWPSSWRGRDLLSFAANGANMGPRPLVVEGFRRPGTDVMDAYQYFRDADGRVVGKAPVGRFGYDTREGHTHWHFRQFVAYSLLDADSAEVMRSRKQAFCLAPTDPVDLTVEGANWTPWSLGFGTNCGSARSLWIRETLDVGWGDTYYQGLPGQALNVTTVPNGWYTLRVEVNPRGALYETTAENNVADRLLYLGGRPGRRTVTVVPWHGIDV